ncbi:MAG: heme exporter protein CcmD [Pseudomonadota bacterium]
MIDLGKHAVFIWSAYAVFAGGLLALIAWLLLDGRRHASTLKSLQRTRTTDDRTAGS